MRLPVSIVQGWHDYIAFQTAISDIADAFTIWISLIMFNCSSEQ